MSGRTTPELWLAEAVRGVDGRKGILLNNPYHLTEPQSHLDGPDEPEDVVAILCWACLEYHQGDCEDGDEE